MKALAVQVEPHACSCIRTWGAAWDWACQHKQNSHGLGSAVITADRLVALEQGAGLFSWKSILQTQILIYVGGSCCQEVG